jgi:hypothetical protein
MIFSSISTLASVTGTVFAKKHSSGGGGARSASSDGGSSDNGGGTTDTGGSENSNGGSGDTSNTTPTLPATTQQTCPDGSTPDSSGNCPTPTPPKEQNIVPQTLAPPPATAPTNTPPLQPVPTTPPPTTSPLTREQLAKCTELGVSPDSPACQRAIGATPPLQPLAKQNTGVLPANPDGSCPPDYAMIDTRCVGVLPGSATGTGGGFIQMIPTKPQQAVNGHQATQTPAAAPPATPPALPPTVCPPNQHYDTSQQKCVDVLK